MTTKNITIAGTIFEIALPYAAGHVLTDGEAKALNQTFCENVRNNMAKKVKDEGATAEDVAAYAAGYEFTITSGGGGSRTVDPVEREAKRLAKEAIKAALAKAGHKLTDVPKEALDTKIEEMAAQPRYQKQAKENLEKQQKLAAEDLGDLLGNVG